MAVGLEWAKRNLGIDEAAAPAVALSAAADEDIQRELIEFDSEADAGARFLTSATQAAPALSQLVDIAWPKGLEPQPGTTPTGSSLPKADVLIVTWTVDEGHALSRVLTPGSDSATDWKPYTKDFARISARMRPGCPARNAGRLGTYWTTTIGQRAVALFKSDSHMSQDGPELPNVDVWRQIVGEVAPQFVITTGTGGGIGPDFEVGDVIVSRFVRFDCRKKFPKLNGNAYSSRGATPSRRFANAKSLFRFNAQFLPKDNSRSPRIVQARSQHTGIVTTDFFGFDNSDDTYKLQGEGDLSEMGDAIVGMVCDELGAKAPPYAIVRNVSDPQIESTGLTIEQQTKMAADIYKAYGRWSSVCSAIVCWAIVASL